jgi:(p)ppGpp synthase/HD superfamily hydrolase
MEEEKVDIKGSASDGARAVHIARAVTFAVAALAARDAESSLLELMGHMFLIAGALMSWAAGEETIIAAILRVAFEPRRDPQLLDQIWDEFGEGVALLVESPPRVGNGPQDDVDEMPDGEAGHPAITGAISTTDGLIMARTTLDRLIEAEDNPPKPAS